VVLDVFNVFNRNEVLENDQDYIYEGMTGFSAWEVSSNLDTFGNPRFNPNLARSPFFDTPILFQNPRSVQLGFNLRF
jgi:hypothetical protein